MTTDRHLISVKWSYKRRSIKTKKRAATDKCFVGDLLPCTLGGSLCFLAAGVMPLSHESRIMKQSSISCSNAIVYSTLTVINIVSTYNLPVLPSCEITRNQGNITKSVLKLTLLSNPKKKKYSRCSQNMKQNYELVQPFSLAE